MRFSGKLIVVTGGTGGLGRAVSLAFLQEGARVAVTYRDPAEFDALKTAAGSNASSLLGEAVDVTDEAATRRFVDGILASGGQIDALVNAVGGYAGGIKLWELDPQTFEKMLALNLRSGYTLARVVIPSMLKQKQGAIVNVSSQAAVQSCCWRFGLRGIESGCPSNDGLFGRRRARHRYPREYDPSEHHRHGTESTGDAQSRFREVAKAGRDCARDFVPVQR